MIPHSSLQSNLAPSSPALFIFRPLLAFPFFSEIILLKQRFDNHIQQIFHILNVVNKVGLKDKEEVDTLHNIII